MTHHHSASRERGAPVRFNSIVSAITHFFVVGSFVLALIPTPIWPISFVSGQPWQTDLVLDASSDLLVSPAAPAIKKGLSDWDKQQLMIAQTTMRATTNCDARLVTEQKQAILEQAAARFDVPLQLLKAIHEVESGGQVCSFRASPVGAQGPFQFLPATWRKYAFDGDGNGTANIHDIRDAAYGASRLLAANGAAGGDYRRALLAYNHAQWYVVKVLSLAAM